MPRTFTQRLSGNANDAAEFSNSTSFTSGPTATYGAGIVAGRSGAAGNPYHYSGFRFTNVTIAKNMSIVSAKITFTDQNNNNITSMTVPIYCEAADNAVDFASSATVTGRTLTSAIGTWSTVSSQTTDTARDTDDFVLPVREVINRAGWVSGNSLMVLFRTSSATINQSYQCPFYEDSATKCALLTIVYGHIDDSDTEVTTDSATVILGSIISVSDTSTSSDSATLKHGFGNQSKSSSTWTNQTKK